LALRVARGLFRLWLVLSVLWIGGVGYALSTQARAESGQYKIRPLDLNNPADQEMLIRMLDPNGTADRDELIRTAIDLDKRFKATNRDLAATGLQRSTTRHQTTSILQ
jgi:hypothetical protein